MDGLSSSELLVENAELLKYVRILKKTRSTLRSSLSFLSVAQMKIGRIEEKG